MKKNSTELVFILDKSGSMAGLEKDTIGGFNAMLEKQRKVDGSCFITTVLFDHRWEILHDHLDIRVVKEMTEKEYQVGGSTALIDAMGMTVKKIINVQKGSSEDGRADKVLFVIITDGEENSSREYTAEKVKVMLKDQKEKYGWEFIFLGANLDAVETANNMGISSDRAVDYLADREGTDLNFKIINQVATRFRSGQGINETCFQEIRSDYKKRK